LIAANMDVIGTLAMARALSALGAMTALHKHYPAQALIDFFRSEDTGYVFYSLGTTEDDWDKFRRVLSAVIECADAAHGLKGQVCADGGCTVPGDVAKAYGAGADFVMLGGMLAGHDECEGELRFEERGGAREPVAMTFYGMSSDTAMRKHAGGVARYRAPEGKTVEVTYRGPVTDTMGEIAGGVRSMMTYIGATTLKEVPKRTTFVLVGSQLNTVFGA
jgi:guanosine monophosphate reductase